MLPILEMEHIHFRTHQKTILAIPSFDLYEGDFLGIMGPNGAGKSSFLKILAFLENPTSGVIRYRGVTYSAKSIPLATRRKFSVALQQSHLLQGSVFENIAISLKLRNTPKLVINEKVHTMLDMFEISHLVNKSTKHLSGGEAQRVNLARALVVEPEVLFLDEPFSALDFPTKMKLIDDLKRIMQWTDTSTVLISHDLLEIQALTNRLLILNEGEIEQIGALDDVMNHPTPMVDEFFKPWKQHFPSLDIDKGAKLS